MTDAEFCQYANGVLTSDAQTCGHVGALLIEALNRLDGTRVVPVLNATLTQKDVRRVLLATADTHDSDESGPCWCSEWWLTTGHETAPEGGRDGHALYCANARDFLAGKGAP